jgi:hypothetical protein
LLSQTITPLFKESNHKRVINHTNINYRTVLASIISKPTIPTIPNYNFFTVIAVLLAVIAGLLIRVVIPYVEEKFPKK